MAINDHVDLNRFMEGLKRRNPGELEFHQAVYEVASNVFDYIADKEIYHEKQILRRIAEPDRVLSFRVCWEDDNGQHTREPRLPGAEQQRDRPVQGRAAVPPLGQPLHPQVPGLRAGLQKLASPPSRSAGARAGRTSTPRASRTPRSCGSASPS